VAVREARALGFPVATDGDGWRRVAVQHPSAGTPLALRRTVRLAADSRDSESHPIQGQMPDLRGRSARQAVAWLAALGVPATLSGTGAVTDQSPAPGSPLPDAAHLTCE
jgi:cell division protein FtsI (penicillin-binding protein 3)